MIEHIPAAYLLYANIVFCVGIFVHGVCTLNNTTKATDFWLRKSYTVLTLGAAASALGPFFKISTPDFADVLMAAGILSVLLACRRSRFRKTLRGRDHAKVDRRSSEVSGPE